MTYKDPDSHTSLGLFELAHSCSGKRMASIEMRFNLNADYIRVGAFASTNNHRARRQSSTSKKIVKRSVDRKGERLGGRKYGVCRNM